MIEVRALSLQRNKRELLASVTLTIPPGAIFGLIGRYADGGPLLLRALATLVQPSAGDVQVNGYALPTASREVRTQVGFVPAVPLMDERLSCATYLHLFAACYGVSPGERAALVDDLLALAELSQQRDKPIKLLTPPMRKRLDLVRALVNDPPVLLLEEPFALLDPRAQVELRRLLRSLSELGKTIVLTLPNLALAQGLCTHAALFDAGHLLVTGTLEEVLNQHTPRRTILVRMLGDVSLAQHQLHDAPKVIAVEASPTEHPEPLLKTLRIHFYGDYAEAKAVLQRLMHSGVQLVWFEEER